MPLQCENCGEDKITVEQFKQGVTKCPECMRERTKQLCAESDARRKRLRAAQAAAKKAQPNESLTKGTCSANPLPPSKTRSAMPGRLKHSSPWLVVPNWVTGL